MRTNYGVAFCLAIVLFAFSVMPAYAIEKLDIKAEQDTAYMPFRYNPVQLYDYTGTAYISIMHPACVYTQKIGKEGSPTYIGSSNTKGFGINPAVFSHQHYPDMSVFDDDPIRLTINDWSLYNDAIAGCKALIGTGFRNDTAYVFKLFPETDSVKYKFLASGYDLTGDGRWIPHIYFMLIEDYDYDGYNELFVYLSSERDGGPRRLYCIELETMKTEWELEVSSQIQYCNFFSCKDSLNPSVIFITGNHMQGRVDSNYSDLYAYVSIVNNTGELTYNRITAVRASRLYLIPAETAGEFFLLHETPLIDPDSVRVLEKKNKCETLYFDEYTISKINKHGEVLCSIKDDEFPVYLWVHPFGKNKKETLFSRSVSGIIKAYDTSLKLLAKSEPVQMGFYLGPIKIKGYRDALVYSDGIYTHDLKKLLHFPLRPSYCQALVMDDDSNVTDILFGGGGISSYGHIEKREWISLLSVFYHRNQAYLLMLLSGLVVGVIAVNYYRSRNKHTLNLIKKQKQELEETHEKLRQAQEKIVAQEKYRQAKDIAGGFAHEIRNALFPAEALINKLMRTDMKTLNNPEKLNDYYKRTRNAVTRAIEITELISQYTKLDSMVEREPVSVSQVLNEVFEANKLRIEEQRVTIDYEPNTIEAIVEFNKKQLYIVFNNLLLNSLDALATVNNPNISITGEKREKYLIVSFSDNGSGISEEHLNRIFDTFFSTKPNKGTGIGLSMVKKIVEMYDGAISVRSEKNRGTTFTIELKLSARA